MVPGGPRARGPSTKAGQRTRMARSGRGGKGRMVIGAGRPRDGEPRWRSAHGGRRTRVAGRTSVAAAEAAVERGGVGCTTDKAAVNHDGIGGGPRW